ncbi:MAG: hypothetical protein ABJB86_09305 [Bacteroidota bacterium]
MLKIAFIYIKKSGGGGRSNHNDLLSHLSNENHMDYVQRQNKIIEPDLIILCLSFNKNVSEKILPGLNEEMEQCGYFIEVAKFNHYVVIDFYYPSSRNSSAAAHRLLQNFYKSKVFKDLSEPS